MRFASFAGVALAALLTASVARADDATMDAVHLRNGGLYRGRVTEIVPGDHVSITVATSGETKRIPWPDVDRVIVASTPIPAAPTAGGTTATTPAPAPTPVTPPAPMVGPRTRVHITSPKQVILYRKAAGTSSFQQACTSPCDQEMPVNDTYRLAGNGLSQNKEFHLGGAGGSIDIVVDPPSVGGMILGGFIAGGGATAAYVGLLMALIGQENADRSCYSYSGSCDSNKSDGETLRNAGLITMLVGAGVTALGIVVFINSASTDVTMKAAGGGGNPEAMVRKPTWKALETAGGSATFPLVFTAHF